MNKMNTIGYSPSALRCGSWQRVLIDVECDVLICDLPFGSRTHSSLSRIKVHDGIPRAQAIGYDGLTPEQVQEFCVHFSPRTAGWFCVLTSHDLLPVWEKTLEQLGRYVFAPIACVQRGRNVRLLGDGPANWTDWLLVARPRTRHFARWGALPGAYVTSNGRGMREPNSIVGGKPLSLMTAIVRDYSRPNNLVCDPCAGLATTAVACTSLGRRFVGAEIDIETHRKATQRIERGVQLDLFGGAA